MSQFDTATAFYAWADSYMATEEHQRELALHIDKEIFGFGFALACDFLKDVGYIQFAKPDTHLKNLFFSLQLCPSNSSDTEVLTAINQFAKHVGVTPKNIDKLFYLIGSGHFTYDHQGTVITVNIGRHREKFVEYAREKGRI